MKKVLFVPFRHNPNDLMRASGMEYNYLASLKRSFSEKQFVTSDLITENYSLWEKIIVKVFQGIFRYRYPKFKFSLLVLAKQKLISSLKSIEPEFVFSLNYNAFTFLRKRTKTKSLKNAPVIYLVDTMFKPWFDQYPQFPKLSQYLMIWQERRALRHIDYIISTSEKNSDYLVNYYGFNKENILTIVNPDAFPVKVLDSDVKPANPNGMVLLFNGRERGRKNFQFFIQIAKELLDVEDIEFQVIGIEPREEDKLQNITWLGKFNKLDPEGLRGYMNVYRNTDLLLHPAHFDASPITVSEAAAFGVPTMAFKVGGMETSVKDGISGKLFEKETSAEEWVKHIMYYYHHKDELNHLRKTTRERYKKEMCWDVVDEQIRSFILQKIK